MDFDERGLPTEDLDNIDFSDLVVEKEIGKGSYGTVYKASFFGVDVAVKQIKRPTGPDAADFEKYLTREIEVQKCMRHPNIVQFVGVAKKKDETWLALQFVGGGGLDNYLENEKRAMTWDVRLKVALDIAHAMAYLHSKKILYRDLKAKNVVVEETITGGLKAFLCDFGFARTLAGVEIQRQQAHLTICGTDDYMAPEVILGMPYDQMADVYSFGIFVLELLYRKKLGDILDRKPQNAFDLDKDDIRKKLPSDCPPLFTELFLACCEYEPKKRPSFKDIIVIVSTMLKNMLKHMPGGGAQNNAASNPGMRPPTSSGRPNGTIPATSSPITSSPATSSLAAASRPSTAPSHAPATSPRPSTSNGVVPTSSPATSSPASASATSSAASNTKAGNRMAINYNAPPLKPAMANAVISSPPTTHKAAPIAIAAAPDAAAKSRPNAQRAPPLFKAPSATDLGAAAPKPATTAAHARSPSSGAVAPAANKARSGTNPLPPSSSITSSSNTSSPTMSRAPYRR